MEGKVVANLKSTREISPLLLPSGDGRASEKGPGEINRALELQSRADTNNLRLRANKTVGSAGRNARVLATTEFARILQET